MKNASTPMTAVDQPLFHGILSRSITPVGKMPPPLTSTDPIPTSGASDELLIDPQAEVR
jgi:hypothetical protein